MDAEAGSDSTVILSTVERQHVSDHARHGTQAARAQLVQAEVLRARGCQRQAAVVQA